MEASQEIRHSRLATEIVSVVLDPLPLHCRTNCQDTKADAEKKNQNNNHIQKNVLIEELWSTITPVSEHVYLTR
jgi:hypothetical protein